MTAPDQSCLASMQLATVKENSQYSSCKAQAELPTQVTPAKQSMARFNGAKSIVTYKDAEKEYSPFQYFFLFPLPFQDRNSVSLQVLSLTTSKQFFITVF